MKKILTIDIGNSNIKAVLYNETGIRQHHDRCETLKEAKEDLYDSYFERLNEEMGLSHLKGVVISCVVPPIIDTVMASAKKNFPEAEVILLQASKIPGFIVNLDNPDELGADIAATAAAAYYKFDEPTIIADLGSASKLSVVNTKNFEILGVVILPGLKFQAHALHQMIPHLPEVEMEKPEKVLGTTTPSAIASGIVYGGLSAVTGLGQRIEKELGFPCKKVITGGLAKIFDPDDLQDFEFDEFLVTDGLYGVARELFNLDEAQ